MIILRQKLYNRHDIEVLKEIHAATNGFRKGLDPNKVKMTARDVYRLNDFTSQLYQYSKGRGKVNWEEFSTLAEHLGLPKTAKYGKHAIEKLYNPELIERAKRIKAHKMGVGKEYEEGEKLAKKLRTLQKKTNRVYAAYWKDKIGYDEFSKTLDEIRKKETNLESKYDKLVVKVDEAVRRHDSKFLRRINERSSAAQDSALEAINKIENTPVSTEGEGLSQKIKHEATKKRYKVNIVEDSDCGHYHEPTRTISGTAQQLLRPATIGHELGHGMWNRKIARHQGHIRKGRYLDKRSYEKSRAYQGDDGCFGKKNRLFNVANELGATSSYFAGPIYRSATPLERANQQNELRHKYNTYLFNTYGGVARDIGRKLKLELPLI